MPTLSLKGYRLRADHRWQAVPEIQRDGFNLLNPSALPWRVPSGRPETWRSKRSRLVARPGDPDGGRPRPSSGPPAEGAGRLGCVLREANRTFTSPPAKPHCRERLHESLYIKTLSRGN